MILQRILAVFSACLLVGTVALAILGPPGLPLGQLLLMLHHDLVNTLHRAVVNHLAGWVWIYVVMPLLLRPAWLLPASAGLIFAGAALSLSYRKPARRAPRRSQ
ncbi:MAG: hypothetical protein JO227_15010 [Acetobacteraceae bacterium]|nr:hypothetical protein [Acetobacteraceae bacterium]